MNALSLEQVSNEQIRMMKHALGLNYKKRPYRNYFFLYADSDGNDELNDLVSKGFAVKRKGWGEGFYYHLTFEAVKLVYGKRISKNAYEEL